MPLDIVVLDESQHVIKQVSLSLSNYDKVREIVELDNNFKLLKTIDDFYADYFFELDQLLELKNELHRILNLDREQDQDLKSFAFESIDLIEFAIDKRYGVHFLAD